MSGNGTYLPGREIMDRTIKVTRRYTFEAGHWLPKVGPAHKCARKHGHNYEFDVVLWGDIGQDGFLIDFWDLDALVEPIIALVDHQMLNDIPGLDNPTAEKIAWWLIDKIYEMRVAPPQGAGLAAEAINRCRQIEVTVFETKNCSATALQVWK